MLSAMRDFLVHHQPMNIWQIFLCDAQKIFMVLKKNYIFLKKKITVHNRFLKNAMLKKQMKKLSLGAYCGMYLCSYSREGIGSKFC